MKYELTINDETYSFKFGFAFMRELNKTATVPVDGMPGKVEEVGMKYELAKLADRTPETLVEVLYIANKTEDPRIKKTELEEYLEGEECDMEQVFDEVIDFLSRANVSKKDMKAVLEIMKAQQEAAQIPSEQ